MNASGIVTAIIVALLFVVITCSHAGMPCSAGLSWRQTYGYFSPQLTQLTSLEDPADITAALHPGPAGLLFAVVTGNPSTQIPPSFDLIFQKYGAVIFFEQLVVSLLVQLYINPNL